LRRKTKKASPVKPDKTRPQTSTYMTKGESEKFSSNSPLYPLFLPSKPRPLRSNLVSRSKSPNVIYGFEATFFAP
ncbi:MAG: hypothetical protein IJ496_02385, partial [Ruminococcus sp.]|nr:hypothetical protein [Ruminococcus sp.]